MKKTLLIIQREYLTRVRKKTFIISTILFPLIYLLFIFGMGYLAKKSSKQLRVAVIDPSGMLNQRLVAESNLRDSASYLEYVTTNQDSVAKHLTAMGFDGYIVLPAAYRKARRAAAGAAVRKNTRHSIGQQCAEQAE
jgi:ABC-2 type transport system permease protein